jgi:hypothetical protein
MSALQQIAYYMNIRDEVPNQALARRLAEDEDREGLAEIAAHMQDKNASVASDCLKVMYETGYLKPELIASYAQDFVGLLSSKNNRLVWGAMIGLSTIADINPKPIAAQLPLILSVMEKGSVITIVSGVRTLGKLFSAVPDQADKAMAYLSNLLETCIPRDVATHGESLLPMMNAQNVAIFRLIFESRVLDMSASQARRMRAVLKKMEKLVV